MKLTRWIFFSLTGLAIVLTSAYALVTPRSFRTTAEVYSFTQGKSTATTLAGYQLANLAMGRTATSIAEPHQVLALTLPCNFSSASLVVYDQSTAHVVATLASAGDLHPLVQIVTNRDNQVRFLAQFQINQVGTPANGLLGGYLTIAGRLHANRTNGCPEAVSVRLDHDRHDHSFGDQDVPGGVDPDSAHTNFRTGLAHGAGVIEAVQNGITDTLIIPFGILSIRDVLP